MRESDTVAIKVSGVRHISQVDHIETWQKTLPGVSGVRHISQVDHIKNSLNPDSQVSGVRHISQVDHHTRFQVLRVLVSGVRHISQVDHPNLNANSTESRLRCGMRITASAANPERTDAFLIRRSDAPQ